MTFHVPNQFRIRTGRMGTDDSYGNNGAFQVRNTVKRPRAATPFNVIASDGGGWEHVSVSLPERCPLWAEMCFIKALFWDAEDTVMQLHPPESTWVNNQATCLHLWRPTGIHIPLPPTIMVGIQGVTPEQVKALMGGP